MPPPHVRRDAASTRSRTREILAPSGMRSAVPLLQCRHSAQQPSPLPVVHPSLPYVAVVTRHRNGSYLNRVPPLVPGYQGDYCTQHFGVLAPASHQLLGSVERCGRGREP